MDMDEEKKTDNMEKADKAEKVERAEKAEGQGSGGIFLTPEPCPAAAERE